MIRRITDHLFCIFIQENRTKMDHYQETFKTWNKVADLYADKFMELDLYNDTYDAFCKVVPIQNSKILEIGCGPGNISKYLLSKRPDFNLLGIDIAPNMIKLAQKNNPSAIFKTMDCRNIVELETKFDAIICGFCIPYLSNSDCVTLIKNCHHLLSKKGILYLSFAEGDPTLSGYQTGSQGDKMYFFYHSTDYLTKVLVRHQFSIVNSFYKDYTKKDKTAETHKIMIAKKN